MPLETFAGHDLAGLFALAQQRLGPDAVILSTRRTPDGFEMTAADQPPVLAPRAGDPSQGSLRPRLQRAAGGSRRPFIIAAVGPTGAGKTTTLAKLATHQQVFGGMKTGLLCLDTYRVGALEQSAQYAEIAGLPLQVVYEPGDIRPALRALEDCRVILVDTAGRGPARGADIDATRSLLRQVRPDEVHLVLPAGLQRAVIHRVIQDYTRRGLTHLLATKLDEFPEETELFAQAREASLPMRWLTDGQDVPTDLRSAEAHLARAAAPQRVARAGAA